MGIDSWGLGCLIYEIFSGLKLSKTEELRNTASLPKSILPDYQRLLSSTPSRRLNSSKLVENCGWFPNGNFRFNAGQNNHLLFMILLAGFITAEACYILGASQILTSSGVKKGSWNETLASSTMIFANAASAMAVETIYHVGSSVSNPLKYKQLQKTGCEYFFQHPWTNVKDGKPIIVHEVKVLSSMSSFHRYFNLHYMLPLQCLRVLNSVLCHAFDGKYENLKRKINFALRMVELYKPYLFSKSFYDDTNTKKLRQVLGENEVESNIFYFDPKTIDWDDYLFHIHIPGVVKHVF